METAQQPPTLEKKGWVGKVRGCGGMGPGLLGGGGGIAMATVPKHEQWEAVMCLGRVGGRKGGREEGRGGGKGWGFDMTYIYNHI